MAKTRAQKKAEAWARVGAMKGNATLADIEKAKAADRARKDAEAKVEEIKQQLAEARAAAGVTVSAERTLRFFDEPDGTVRVEDGETGEVLSRFAQGEGGFIRATVRSLVHQRRIRNLGPQVPFTLTRWTNDTLTLADPLTGRSVEVSSFGPDNRAVYANMLPPKAKPETR